ncbi:hypothetical protein [Roseococcus sp. YIM B11640]|uniref:hypothetical protein n=1 Tax=Roseococcus sp. YIM B11640 TaxID=3133973 RepID=UPI003C7A1053
MASLFRAPKPVVVAPPKAQTAVTQQVAAANTDAAEKSAAEEARVESRNRARSGIVGTIATSARGVLSDPAILTTRKSLLGE